MKKLTSLLLTFVMLFSLTMPAMAADVSGNKTANVSGTYNPTIVIRDIALSGENVTVDEENRIYTVTVPADAEKATVTVTVSGQNLDMIPEENYWYKIIFEEAAEFRTDTYDSNTGKLSWNEEVAPSTVEHAIQYSTDNGTTWTETGWTVVVKKAEVEIPTTKTIYFDNTENWSTVYAYAWKDANELLGSWPGTVMTKVEGTENIYTIVVPSEAVNIIFNDGSDKQTADLTIPTDDKNLYTNSTGEWSVYGSTTEPTAEITGVTITIDGVEYSSTNTSEADPAVITPNTQSLTLKVTGTNLQYNERAIVSYAPSKNADTVHARNEWIVSEDGTSATKDISAFLEVLSSTTSVWELQYANDGDTLESSGVYVIYQVPTYAVNISAAIAGGTVTASPNPAEEGQTVTVTVEPVAGYAYVVGSLKVINEATGLEVPVDEASKTFTMPDSTVMVSAEFEELTVTSADISWGSMAFTYTDGEDGAEGAWTADAAEGAGTVTVENTGTTAISVSATYASIEEYQEIEGTLGDAKTLAATEKGTFTLTLSGKPGKAIPAGTKIGSVTVKIEEVK